MAANDSPLVLLVCIDALRYDCVNYQGETPYFDKLGFPRRLNTPTFDAIAEESVRFHKTVSHAGYTPLSLSTVLTGTYARAHGVVDFQNTRCRNEVKTLPSVFKANDWRTCAVWGPEFFKSIGLTRDVDHVFADEAPLLKLLESEPDKPTFAFVHFNDVHHPYIFSYWDDPRCDNRDFAIMMQLIFGLWVDEGAREFVDGKGNRAAFDKWSQLIASPIAENMRATWLANLFKCYTHGIQKFDQTRLAAFVERLKSAGVWERAIVVFFADHGEISMPRAPWALNHDKYVLEQLMRVPMTIKAPGLRPRDVHSLTGLVDLFPTLLELAGCAAPELPYELDGRGLGPAIQSDQPVQEDYYHEGWSVLVAEQRQRPVLYQRAIRRQDDVKFVFTGDVVDPVEFEALDEEQFVQYAIEKSLGEIAYPATRAELRRQATGDMPRQHIVAALTNNVPRFRRFDLKADRFEEKGQVLQAGQPGWHEYAKYLRRMIDLRGRPNEITADNGLNAEEEQRLLKHLGQLGYVEA